MLELVVADGPRWMKMMQFRGVIAMNIVCKLGERERWDTTRRLQAQDLEATIGSVNLAPPSPICSSGNLRRAAVLLRWTTGGQSAAR
ncbi:hypothetical protein E2562_021335 [Oryza meyeriana var. granulata]|uniref:Uncharacterized protein n=1 Tax=Oryza meyeriana var. granulata TaxID=110450 RepID=A0A6G1BYV5_9ORYZ|nr:hypothetical protein E2562_021335 [Oryza meyeriana var. granulata]